MVAIEQLLVLRKTVLSTVSDLSQEQLEAVPEGFNNNILWNLSHLVVTQQLLCYKLSGLEMLVDARLVEENRKGTSPANWSQKPDLEEMRSLLLSLPEKLGEDYEKGIFSGYQPYETSAGVTLKSIDDAISFNLFHEGIHFGSVLALKRFVSG
jgi:hypothetical protein